MDTSDPEIRFDAGGVCNNCSDSFESRTAALRDPATLRNDLETRIEKIRFDGRGSTYDCLIGMSGGVDSSYLAYLAKVEFGLRPLAVHLDNGWDSSDAVWNIRNVISPLNIDYEAVVLDWPEFRELQLAFLRASVPEAETPTDVAIPEALYTVAERHGIRYILSAGNVATEGVLPKCWHYNARDRKYFSYICRTFGKGIPERFDFYDYQREAYFKLVRGIKTVYPLDHLHFTKNSAIDLLKEKFGFRYYGEKHFESLYTRFIQGYYLDRKFGIDYRRATFSSQIMDGQLTRDEAIDRLAGEELYKGSNIERDKHYVAKKLQISADELERIIAMPPRWYRELPNDERKLALIYSVYRTLYGKRRPAALSATSETPTPSLTRT
jgi:N-acetyl sugar amidotransferase